MAHLLEALSFKLEGSIPDDIIGIFHCLSPFSHLLPWNPLSLLTEISTRDISWGGGGLNVAGT